MPPALKTLYQLHDRVFGSHPDDFENDHESTPPVTAKDRSAQAPRSHPSLIHLTIKPYHPAMTIDVLAEDLQPGDLLELSTETGTQVLRLTYVERRTQGIKFMGRNDQGVLYSSGMKYGELARCSDKRCT
ncbi:hypothetical protein [Streptomyces niveus]|uniref:hypothetical protein n=1 Tax=Streptomyces niveus TaxID=193462 RepID=UPI00342C9880